VRPIERNLPWLGRLGGNVLLAGAVTVLVELQFNVNGWLTIITTLVTDAAGTLAVLGILAERQEKKRLELTAGPVMRT